jgi:hypothetical protein
MNDALHIAPADVMSLQGLGGEGLEEVEALPAVLTDVFVGRHAEGLSWWTAGQ